MPTLIKAEDILKDEQKEKEIELLCYDIPDGQDAPVLKIVINDKTREAYRKAYNRHVMPKALSKPGQRGMEIQIKDESFEFVMSVLRLAYLSAENWIDKPSMLVIEKYLKRTVTVSKVIANALIELFEEDELIKKKEEDDDEKN